jgi:sulfite reductase (NADPH) flavoprotein alpha-component
MSQAVLPQTAPFSEEQRVLLDRVVQAASPTQRAWLSGFLAGLDAAAAPASVAAEAPRKALPLTVLYASESGNCERLAADAAKLARKRGFKPKVVDMAELELSALPKAGPLLVIAATWGEGEPPARAAHVYRDLMGDAAPRLEGVDFAVLSLGDSAYPDFCAVGQALDARLEALGARRVAERADCDLDFEAPAAAWIRGALDILAPEEEAPAPGNVVTVDFAGRAQEEGSQETSRDPVAAEVAEHVNLNSSRSDKETFHVALSFEAAPAYEPGDALEVFAPNDPRLAEAVAAAAGLKGDGSLVETLAAERDICTLSLATIERYVAATNHEGARRLLKEGDARAWIEGRHLLDLLEAYPAALDAAALTSVTRPLAPRAYSIASSRKEVGDEAHLLVAPVRYETHGRARSGVASTHIAERLRAGGEVRVRLKPNRHFRLPDPATDVIMVGPGTGVAPFRGFVQERRATGATGRSWLFFGDRRYTHDFLYQLEWQEALKDGALTRLDVAFSRDAPEKTYVQHRLRERRRDVVDWLENGARFYVCGDAKAMAKDVRAALVRAYEDVLALSTHDAEAKVAGLERSARYLQDVY